MKSFPSLYDTDSKGKTRVWDIQVITNPEYSTIITTHGLVDGKKITDEKRISIGKNIGKKNETSHFDQACSQANSTRNKKLDKGYKESLSSDLHITPMLAQTLKKLEDVRKLGNKVFIQPKLDGVRMLVGRDTKIVMMSRMGKIVTSVPHIEKACSFLKEGEWLDGECFTKELPFERITGAFRREDETEDSKLLEFHVFDMFILGKEKMRFTERYEYLNHRAREAEALPLVMVRTLLIDATPENIEKYHGEFVIDGYEGIIIRKADGEYKLGKRSSDLLKYKTMDTEEFEIVGAEQGDGRDLGSVVWKCAVGVVTFDARPRGTLEQRKYWWDHRNEFIGQMLTVRFQGLSKDGIPRFPVGLVVRDYEK